MNKLRVDKLINGAISIIFGFSGRCLGGGFVFVWIVNFMLRGRERERQEREI